MSLKSYRYLIGCVCVVLGFVLFGIFPNYQTHVAMDRQIAKIREEIAEQRALFPLFQKLLAEAQSDAPSDLPFPKKAKLPKNETGGISLFFQKLARDYGFEVINITPDIITMTGSSGLIRLDMVITGRFADLRSLLLRMGEIPYMEHIESIDIHAVGEKKEIRLIFWIAQG